MALNYRLQTKFAKVMFLHLSVRHSVHGGGVSQHALQVSVYRGVVSQHALQVSRPTPGGKIEGSGLGGLQAHSPGGVSRPTPGGSPVPHLGGWVSQHALRKAPPPEQTATAAGGMHPTGMHSC